MTAPPGLGSLSSLAGRRPEWSVLAAAAAGWVLLSGLVWWPAGHAGHHHPALLGWLLMTVAMMLPTTVPAVRYVAFASRRRRRQRSILAFCLGYLASWLALGGVVSAVLALTAGPLLARPDPLTTAIAQAVAAGWELTGWKRLALRRCHRTYPIRFRGFAADASAAAYGLRHGLTCLGACGPAMTALMVAGHPLVLTAVVSALMFAQLMLRESERWRPAVAVGGVAGALLVLGIG